MGGMTFGPLLLLLLASTPDALGSPGATERIESITTSPDGKSGRVVTRAIALDGGARTYQFGGKACAGHRLDATVRAELFDALRTGQGVTIIGIEAGLATCLGDVTFWAPDA